MYSGNQSSFSDKLDCSPLCDGPHPEGKPSIRDPVINRGGEFAPGIQREQNPTGGICMAGRAGPRCWTLLTGHDKTLGRTFSFRREDGFQITAALTLSKQNLIIMGERWHLCPFNLPDVGGLIFVKYVFLDIWIRRRHLFKISMA